METLDRRGMMIASHRGSATCGNIIENTVSGFACGLKQHADILELDVVRSTDGKLFVFHDSEKGNNEFRLLGSERRIALREMSSEEILALNYRNGDWTPVSQKVNLFDEVLDFLKGRCLINVDRSWDFWADVIPCIERHGMLDQCIIKSDPEDRFLDELERCPIPVMYMPKIFSAADMERVVRRNINIVAGEMIFLDNEADLLSPEAQRFWKERGLLSWTNSLRLNDRWNRNAWHDDNRAILESSDDNWGWLVEHGFNIIQTDWPAVLHEYLVGKGYRT